jgi:hypothetical protein
MKSGSLYLYLVSLTVYLGCTEDQDYTKCMASKLDGRNNQAVASLRPPKCEYYRKKHQ